MGIKKIFNYSVLSLTLVAGMPALTSCEEVANTISDVTDNMTNVSEGETVSALKEALGIGVKTAVNKLSSDGYMSDIATKIGLPEGAQTAFTAYNALMSTDAGRSIAEASGLGDGLEENLITLFNDAATDAAPAAAEIFAKEITSFTIQDGKNILFGGDGAATAKLKNDTQADLMAAFHPTITNSMNNVKLGNITATQMWEKFAKANNALADKLNSTIGKLAISGVKASGQLTESQINAIESIQPVNTDISDFVTGRALDGLFVKVSEKENDIRHNIASRTSDLLQRVFGQLDKKGR